MSLKREETAEFKTAYGWTLPASDEHFESYLAGTFEVNGRRVYQPDHITSSTSLCRRRRVALDVGAHVGMWSYYLAAMFERVHAFEPSTLLQECFVRNVRAPNVTLHKVALGRNPGHAELRLVPDNTGATHIASEGEGSIEVRPLDGYALPIVDFLKVDVEGFELFVFAGAQDTLLRCKPVIIFEQKGFAQRFGGGDTDAADYLASLGAVQLGTVNKDLIYGWRRR
jgi:FkbM family methyltransferase